MLTRSANNTPLAEVYDLAVIGGGINVSASPPMLLAGGCQYSFVKRMTWRSTPPPPAAS
jgi:hypothetical protein